MTEGSRRHAREVAAPLIIKAGFVRDVELQVRRKNGEMLDVLFTGIAEVEEAGEPARTIAFMIDVTESLRAEKSLAVQRRRLAEVEEDERRDVARALHEEIAQELTGLKLLMETTRLVTDGRAKAAVERGLGQVNGLINAVRDLSLGLRPSMLDDLGLLPTLLWLTERHANQTGLRVDFEHAGLSARMAPEIETAAYRITQEALANVAQHASTEEASLFVWADSSTLRLVVTDAGAGFGPSAISEGSDHVGLAAMRERAKLLDGRLSIDSAPGDGTRLSAELPLDGAGEVW